VSEAAFDSVSSVDVEIELLEAKISEAKEQRERLEKDIRDAKYDQQLSEKALLIRQKEADREKMSEELSALNRQADSRAKLAIKKSELTSKTNQVSAS
jgi:DNA repair protein RAD50